tara:strand:+ start:1802 stop:2791 length:990 start_codon:yes stop_codon:yes gene_type:complete
MYGKRELTLDNIRDKVNSFDLFAYYCSTFKKIDDKFCSELRQDKFPTCCIYAFAGKLFYKDFATGESFDDLGYIRHKYNIDFRGALHLINRDFNLDLGSAIVESMPTMQFFGVPDKKININSYIKEAAVIKTKVRPWNIDDKKYWKDKYDFSVKQLEFFNVYPLQYFWINQRMYNSSKNTYGYFMGAKDGNEKWKIYQPKSLKKIKWFSNINKYDLQGYKQLPKSGDVLYITSSLKDVITLRKIKLYAVAPSAESTIIPEEIIEELKNRFDELIIFYDNDEPGIRCSAKHAKLYSAKEIAIPILANVKDPSDYVEKYSYKELLKIILNE